MLLYQIKAAGFLLLVISFLQSHFRHCFGARSNSFTYNLQALAPLARNPMATYPHLVYPLPQDKTEVIVVGDKGGDHHHHHHHHHHHKHGHHHHHGHDHSHSHSHNHGHDHKHNHGHNHNHAHNHNHNHGHQHKHKHKHGHGHFHGHDHKHNHGHFHGHKHDHGHFHGHEHDHDHRHLHGHAHIRAQVHNHLYGRQNEEGRESDHDHNREQARNQRHSNVHLGQYNNERHVSKPSHLSHMIDIGGHSNDVPNSAEHDDQEYKKKNYNSEPEYYRGHKSHNRHSSGNDKAPYEPTFDDNTQDERPNYSDPSHTPESGDTQPFNLGNFKVPLLTPARSYKINFQNPSAIYRGERLNLNNFKEAQDKEASFRSEVHHLRAHGDIVTVDNDDPFISVERPLKVEDDDSQETQQNVQKTFLGDFRSTPADDYDASVGKFDEVWNIPLSD